MKISNVLLVGALLCVPAMSVTSQEAPVIRTFYSAQRPHLPPLPFNPIPGADLVVLDGIAIFDDTQIDYGSYESSMMTSSGEPPVPGPGSGEPQPPPILPPTVPIPGVPLLKIETLDEGVKLVSFNTKMNFLYRVQATDNLSNPVWTAKHLVEFQRNKLVLFAATVDGTDIRRDPSAANTWYQATAPWTKEQAIAETERLMQTLGISFPVGKIEYEAVPMTVKTPNGDRVKVTPFHDVSVYTTNGSLGVKVEFRMGEAGPGRVTRWFDNSR